MKIIYGFIILINICLTSTAISQTFADNGFFYGDTLGGQFGSSIDIDGNWAIIGAPGAIDDNDGSGHALIFKRNSVNGTWALFKTITQDDGQTDDFFGRDVAISNGVIFVGATGDDDQANRSGSVYVFYKDLGGTDNWGFLKKIEASDASGNSFFGHSVDIDNGIGIIASFLGNKVYIVAKDQGGIDNWGEIKQLVRDDNTNANAFGIDVSIDNEIAVVGARFDNLGGSNRGSAYLFSKDVGGLNNWGQLKKIVAPDGNDSDEFGSSVSIHSNRVVIGAPFNTESLSSFFVGAAYVYEMNQGGTNMWGFTKKLKANDGSGGDQFGRDVAMYGDLIISGALNAGGTNPNEGKAYLFRLNSGGTGNWGQLQKLEATGTLAQGQNFGNAVHINHGNIVIGAFRSDENGANNGSAYFFSEPCSDANIDISNNNISSVLNQQLFTSSTAITSDALYTNYPFYGLKAGNNLTFSSGLEIDNGTEIEMRIDFCTN